VAARHKSLFPYEYKKALIASAFFVSAFCVPLAAAECPRLPGGFTAAVAHVYDGDTVRLSDGRKVRLIGVNTPELGRDGRADEPFAVQARQWLVRAVQGRRVYLLPGVESQDRYGRLLAHLYLPNENLSDGELAAEGLVRSGLGYALAVGANSRLADCLFAAEETARSARQRLWQQAPVEASAIASAGFAVVRGRITRVTPIARGTYIDLDRTVALFVPRSVMATAPEHWREGQIIVARGWVVDRLQRQSALRSGQLRWRLNITHPHHLRGD